MKVSVVVPNWNGRHLLGPCLDSLQAQSYRDHEVLLVDDGSSDGSVEMVRKSYPSVRIVRLPQNRGFAKAANLGIENSLGEVIALLNNDTVADKEWLAEAVAALNDRPRIACVASKVLLQGHDGLVDACGDFYSIEGVAGKIGHLEPAESYLQPREVFGTTAGAGIYRRFLFEDVGLFDEDFTMVHEDTDLSFRAQLRGHRCLFVPRAIVHHQVSATLGKERAKQLFLANRNIEFVYFKNMPMPLLLKYLPVHLLANMLLYFDYIFRRRGQLFVASKLQAVRNLPRMTRKRKRIQRERRSSSDQIDAMLFRGWLARSISRRLRSSPNR